MSEDEEFFAWLDGELDPELAGKVEARVAASPEITARAAAQRRLTAGLREAFEPTLAEGRPAPRFDEGKVIDFGARAAGRGARRPFGVPQWAAMAATLALGLLVGNLVGRDPGQSPVVEEQGRIVAAGALDRALDVQLASAPAGDAVRIGLTFRDSAGRICRSFQDRATAGLACREGSQWHIEGLFQGAEGQSSDYRMAGQDPGLAQLIGQKVAGGPFDAAQEKAARDRDWR